MSLTVLADENIPGAEDYFGCFGEVRRADGRALNRDMLVDVDVLLVRSVTIVDKALLADSPVKFVGTATSGIDHIDRDYLASRGVSFAHAPGANANSVVEYVLGAIAAVDDTLEKLMAGRRRVGIVGYGNIGAALAGRLRALGISYHAWDPWLQDSSVSAPDGLEQVLACDVVTLHPELTRQMPWPSHHLLGESRLKQISQQSLLINASRGAVIDNNALLKQLEQGRGPITVLDVWEGEPHINAHLVDRVKLASAHIAGYSFDGKLRATQMLSDSLRQHLQLPALESMDLGRRSEVIHLPPELSGVALLRWLLQLRYDISRDDSLLREVIMQQDEQARAEGFDRLRKQYPRRRELSGSSVFAPYANPADIELLEGLGCEVLAVANDA